MVDIDSLMELFDEMEESEIEKLCLTMNTKAGANFSLIITPPARRVFVHPEPVKVPEKEPEKAPEAVEVKAPAPEKKALSDEPKNEEKKAEAPAAAAPKAEPEKNEAQPVKRRGRKHGRKKKANSYVERVMSEVEDAEDPQDVDTGVFLDALWEPKEGGNHGEN